MAKTTIINGVIRQMTPTEEAEFDRLNPPRAPEPRIFSKKKLFEAMNDGQYAEFETTFNQQPPRKRALFLHAQELNESDPGFPELYGLMVMKYGKQEADRLLSEARV